MSQTPQAAAPIKRLNQLRHIGIVEAISFLILVGIAMPLKYIWGMPLGVRIMGSAHGFLFVLYTLWVFLAYRERSWSLGKSFLIFIASVLPCGPFVAEKWLGAEARQAAAETATNPQ